jgi:hypothetical protein
MVALVRYTQVSLRKLFCATRFMPVKMVIKGVLL